jgi:hypothetical protein
MGESRLGQWGQYAPAGLRRWPAGPVGEPSDFAAVGYLDGAGLERLGS